MRRYLQTLFDPQAVPECVSVGVGRTVSLAVGAKTDSLHRRPVQVTGRVRVISDGPFEEPTHSDQPHTAEYPGRGALRAPRRWALRAALGEANSRSLADHDCTKGTSTEVPFVDVAFQCSKPKRATPWPIMPRCYVTTSR